MVDIRSNSKLGIKANRWTETIDILHRGYTEIDMFTSNGVTPVDTEFGTSSYSWEDANGLSYVIEHYPENNDGAPVTGLVFDGDNAVGQFRLLSTRQRVHKATGRWSGVLAFPGGAEIALALQVSSTPQESVEGCVTYDARINFPGHAYEQTALYNCEEDGAVYSSGFFYVDSVTKDSWFISLDAVVENGAFQGDVHALSLNGNGASWGKVYTERPQAFSL